MKPKQIKEFMLSRARGLWVLPGHQRARVDARARLWLLAVDCRLLAALVICDCVMSTFWGGLEPSSFSELQE